MDISEILDKQTMDAILADAKDAGIKAKDVKAVLGTLTDQNKAPTRSAASQGELLSLLGDDRDAVAADIAEATGVDRAKTSTILMLAAPFLLKYLLGSSSNHNSGGSLLGALLGGGQPQQQTQTSLLGSLLGGGQTQQPAQTSLLSGLLGGGQSQQTVGSNGASLLGSLLGGGQTQQTNNDAGALLSLFGDSTPQPQQPQQSSSQSSGGILNALLNLLGDKN